MPDLQDDLRSYFDELAQRAEHPPTDTRPPLGDGDARAASIRRRGRLRVVAVAAGLVVLAAVVIVATHRRSGGQVDAAGPPTETTMSPSGITAQIDPTTDLQDGQRVHVHASGFAALQIVAITMCNAASTGPGPGHGAADCDLETMAQIPADQAGVVDTTYAVRQLIRVGGAYDCAIEPTGCDVAVGPSLQAMNTPDLAVGTRVTFGPGTPRPLPSITMTPSSNLHDGQVVTVVGSGFAPATAVLVAECPPSTDCGYGPFGVTAQTDADGGFHQDLTLHRTFTIPADLGNGVTSARLDCTTGCAVIATTQSTSAPQLAAEPLPFTVAG